MLNGHNSQLEIPAYVRVVRLAPLLFLLLGLGYGTAMQVEDSQVLANVSKAVSAGIGLDLIGVSSAHAAQKSVEPQGVPYFPNEYVNQPQDKAEHIQAF